MQVEIIEDRARWSQCLAEVGVYDFCHTYDFHWLSCQNGEGKPVGFAVMEGERVGAFWPALSRKIPGTNLTDLTSVYGYAGPVLIDDGDINGNIQLIYSAMREAGYVTTFARMHPLLNCQSHYKEADSERLSEVVIIDVLNGDDVLANYRGSHRREILKARRDGVAVYISRNDCDVREFNSIYSETMAHLKAGSYYHFDDSYFRRLMQSSDFDVFIAFAEHEGRRISGAIFTVINGIMQYYLSGTLHEARKLAPSKLIIAHVHALAEAMGVQKIVLGGGVGSGYDSLFDFKAGFSDGRAPFYVTKRIHKPELYERLCGQRTDLVLDASYFPRYRAK